MSENRNHDEVSPAAQVPDILGFEEVVSHDHSGHDHSHEGHAHNDGQDVSSGHMHGVLEPHQVHMHLMLREANRAAIEGEVVPLGRFPIIVLAPGADDHGNPTLAIDTTGMSPGQAHEIIATAANVLGAALAEGAIDPTQMPLPASQVPNVPFQPSLN